MVSWLATLGISIVVTGALNTLIASAALRRLRRAQERRRASQGASGGEREGAPGTST